MYVAWRDLRFARGRFTMIGAVVALITVLVGFLSGLTVGLASQNVSGILSLPADRIVLQQPAQAGTNGTGPSFSDSALTEEQAAAWASADGVRDAQPLGIGQGRAESGNARAAIALFGARPGFAGAPRNDGEIALARPAATALDAAVGDTVRISGRTFTVSSVNGDGWYSHTPVVWLTLHDWQRMARATGTPGAYATALAVSGSPDWSAVAGRTHTVAQSLLGSLTAVGSFRSEVGSLLLMVVMLFCISALVIGAFFAVWTMQRRGDIAVLKALGASTRALVRDALGQAVVVLLAGAGVGIGVVAALGAVAGSALPFVLSPLTTLLPAALMILLGLGGAAFALRTVTSADPLTALGSNR